MTIEIKPGVVIKRQYPRYVDDIDGADKVLIYVHSCYSEKLDWWHVYELTFMRCALPRFEHKIAKASDLHVSQFAICSETEADMVEFMCAIDEFHHHWQRFLVNSYADAINKRMRRMFEEESDCD